MENYGLWMLAPQRDRKNHRNLDGKGMEKPLHGNGITIESHSQLRSQKTHNGETSRFSTLITEEDEEKTMYITKR